MGTFKLEFNHLSRQHVNYIEKRFEELKAQWGDLIDEELLFFIDLLITDVRTYDAEKSRQVKTNRFLFLKLKEHGYTFDQLLREIKMAK